VQARPDRDRRGAASPISCAQRMARAGLSKAATKPSPVRFTSRP
jgi:hypothetical protein